MPPPKKPGSMSWLDYAFGVASRTARRTWTDMKTEYQAGREGRPSSLPPQRQTPAPSQRPSGPPWWEVLKVPRTATLPEVSAAYRTLIQKNHPDKVSHLSEQIRKVADQETRRINAAYEAAERDLGRGTPPR
jgi:DnaJ-class molecular chaperone